MNTRITASLYSTVMVILLAGLIVSPTGAIDTSFSSDLTGCFIRTIQLEYPSWWQHFPARLLDFYPSMSLLNYPDQVFTESIAYQLMLASLEDEYRHVRRWHDMYYYTEGWQYQWRAIPHAYPLSWRHEFSEPYISPLQWQQ